MGGIAGVLVQSTAASALLVNDWLNVDEEGAGKLLLVFSLSSVSYRAGQTIE